MAEVSAKRTIAKDVEHKAKMRICLVCGGEATGNRGLCIADYLRFYRAMMQKSEKKRPSFEAEQIYEGRILASGHLREINNPNPFKQGTA